MEDADFHFSDRAIWLVTLIFFLPFFFVILAIAYLLVEREFGEPFGNAVLGAVVSGIFTLFFHWYARNEKRKVAVAGILSELIQSKAEAERIKEEFKKQAPLYPFKSEGLIRYLAKAEEFLDPKDYKEIQSLLFEIREYDMKILVFYSSPTSVQSLCLSQAICRISQIAEWSGQNAERIRKYL
jgi:hypothetical protein